MKTCPFKAIFSFLLAGGLLAVFGACDAKDKGPKRKDHKAAHTARYHPDIDRTGTRPKPAAPTTQPDDPAAVANPWQLGPVGTPVLFVNNEPVGVEEILEPILEDLRKQSDTLSEAEYRDDLLNKVRLQIDLEISTILIYQEAETLYTEAQMESIDKEVDKRIKDMINFRFDGLHARYEAHLKSLGLSLDDMKKRAKRSLIVMDFLRRHIRALQREPSRQELHAAFIAQKNNFAEPARAEMFLIEVPFESMLPDGVTPAKASPEDWSAAMAKARDRIQTAKRELASGVEFPAVAKAYSTGLAHQLGGALGEITPGSLTDKWTAAEELCFTLESGTVSDILELEHAYCIVKCGKKTPAKAPTFEAAQKVLTDQLLDRDFNRRRAEYIQKLIDQSTIENKTEFFLAVLAAAPKPPAYRDEPQTSSAGAAPNTTGY